MVWGGFYRTHNISPVNPEKKMTEWYYAYINFCIH
jgi:hypothetical protein